MIDEYKDGKVSIKDFYTVMKSFIGNNILNYGKDEILQKSVHELMANIDSFYIGKSGNEKMEFWKLLKDTQYLLLYGYTYKEHQGRELFLNDSIEYTDEYLTIELEMERMIKDEVGEGGYFGFCHKYWSAKKRILKEYFEIDWKSPEEMNPDVIFD